MSSTHSRCPSALYAAKLSTAPHQAQGMTAFTHLVIVHLLQGRWPMHGGSCAQLSQVAHHSESLLAKHNSDLADALHYSYGMRSGSRKAQLKHQRDHFIPLSAFCSAATAARFSARALAAARFWAAASRSCWRCCAAPALPAAIDTCMKGRPNQRLAQRTAAAGLAHRQKL